MELLDLVDNQDNVIGTTDKQTAHANKQPHRVVGVYVFDKKGRLYMQVHKKSGGLYDHAVGGHVAKGESYQAAAMREAAEELGLNQPLTHMQTFYSDEGQYVHMFAIFTCIADKSWVFVPNDEVGEIILTELEEVRQLMVTHPHKFTGGFINTMREYSRFQSRGTAGRKAQEK